MGSVRLCSYMITFEKWGYPAKIDVAGYVLNVIIFCQNHVKLNH